MKSVRFYALFLLSLLYTAGFGQILQPTKWEWKVIPKNDKEAELQFIARLDEGWHIYSQKEYKDGPLPTIFAFTKTKEYSLDGRATEPSNGHVDAMWAEQDVPGVICFEGVVTFKQKIKILDAKKFTIKGNVSYMVCKESCMPDDKDFSFVINPNAAEASNGAAPDTAGKNAAVVPENHDTSVAKIDSAAPVVDDENFNDSCGSLEGDNYSELSGWAIFIQGLIGGLLALLTPCVFSMIPLTVSFFIKQSKTRSEGFRNASVYSISIVLIYVALGFVITKLFGADTLNKMASDVWFNLAFFFIFIVFAASFLGAFEITLPSSWANKADRAADRGGMIGIFFMAFTLSLVSFSCTGPIIGTLLVQAAVNGSNLGPILGMGGFAIALALPFALFAAFPAWLNTLPKSGGWLNSVKVSLGFIELALALKFFSNVDLAYHWGVLPRELFIALWIVIFGSWGFYLLGKIHFSHDSEVKTLSVSRYLYALVVLSFTVYLIPGLWGAPLKMISGFPPPDFYKEWQQTTREVTHCPHNLSCFHDYDEGMAYAKNQGKPVMIDFTGWSCVNCRKMEDYVWSDPEILKRLREDYVLISLYVDDKTVLPESQQKVSETTGKKIKTEGNKWSDFQTAVYKTNSQPYYVLLDNNGKKLAHPRGNTPDIATYKRFLDEGLCRYKNRQQ